MIRASDLQFIIRPNNSNNQTSNQQESKMRRPVMHHRAKLLAGVCGLLLSSAALQPAMAAAPVGFAGTFGASYGQTSCDGCNKEDVWNANGSAAFGFAPNFGGQVDAGYTGVSGS